MQICIYFLLQDDLQKFLALILPNIRNTFNSFKMHFTSMLYARVYVDHFT